MTTKMISAFTAIVLAVGLMPAPALAAGGALSTAQIATSETGEVQTQAAKPWLPSEIDETYETGKGASNAIGLVIQNYTSSVKVKNLKSSNSKVVKVSWRKGSDLIDMQWRKVGKATVTCDLYSGSKKVRHCKIKVVVTKYACPVQSFKLGAKNYSGKFKDLSQAYMTIKKTKSFKVNVKPKSGWKLNEIMFYNGKTLKQIKNNATVKCSSSWSYVAAYFMNESTGKYQSLSYYISKG